MTKVTDKILAQYAKFQHDMLERVLKGSIDPVALMDVQRPLIGQKKSAYLRLISGEETISISACAGGETANLAHAQKTFKGFVDSDFKSWGLNKPQPATKKINVDVYEMYNKDGDFKTIFGSLSTDFKSLAFESQEQIEKFCQENKKWLRTDGYGTFFLFTEEVDGEDKVFVASVIWHAGKLLVYVNHLSYDNVWNASDAHRVVTPATKISESKS